MFYDCNRRSTVDTDLTECKKLSDAGGLQSVLPTRGGGWGGGLRTCSFPLSDVIVFFRNA